MKIVLKEADALAFKQEVTRRSVTRRRDPDGGSLLRRQGTPGDDLREAGLVSVGDAAETEDYDVRSDFADIFTAWIFLGQYSVCGGDHSRYRRGGRHCVRVVGTRMRLRV